MLNQILDIRLEFGLLNRSAAVHGKIRLDIPEFATHDLKESISRLKYSQIAHDFFC